MNKLASYRKIRQDVCRKYSGQLLLKDRSGLSSKDRREYQQHYYERRKEELSRKRKDKYRQDPEYREKVLSCSKSYREKVREKREKLRAEGKLVSKRHKGPRKPVVLEVNGKSVYAYTISTLAERIGRSIHTVNHWTTIGEIPPTPLWSKRGDRLYTDAMILIVKMAVQSRGIVRNGGGMRGEILDGWRELGIEAHKN